MPTASLHPCTATSLCPHLVNKCQPCPVHGTKATIERARRGEGRGFYSLAKWRHPVWGLRAQVLREQPCCAECAAEGQPYVLTEEVDHIIPHRGDLTRFMDKNNLRAMCKRHHSLKTARGL